MSLMVKPIPLQDVLANKPEVLISYLSTQLALTNQALEAMSEELKQVTRKAEQASNAEYAEALSHDPFH